MGSGGADGSSSADPIIMRVAFWESSWISPQDGEKERGGRRKRRTLDTKRRDDMKEGNRRVKAANKLYTHLDMGSI